MKNTSIENVETPALQEMSLQELEETNGGGWGTVVAKYYLISALSPVYGAAYGIGVAVGYYTG